MESDAWRRARFPLHPAKMPLTRPKKCKEAAGRTTCGWKVKERCRVCPSLDQTQFKANTTDLFLLALKCVKQLGLAANSTLLIRSVMVRYFRSGFTLRETREV